MPSGSAGLWRSLWAEDYATSSHINLLLRLICTTTHPTGDASSTPTAMGSWATGAGSRWDWKPLVCGLHVGGSGMMVAEVWGGAVDLSGSFQGD